MKSLYGTADKTRGIFASAPQLRTLCFLRIAGLICLSIVVYFMGVASGFKMNIAPPHQFLAYLVILSFERRCLNQIRCSFKVNMFGSKILGWLRYWFSYMPSSITRLRAAYATMPIDVCITVHSKKRKGSSSSNYKFLHAGLFSILPCFLSYLTNKFL